MRFAHLADCHVGAWRDTKMKELNFLHFENTINQILEEHIKSPLSFVIIAGDLFNTAVPSIEALKLVTESLKKLQDANLPVLGVAGSHDYSSSGKSMLEVLEKAKLFKNVMKGSIENKKLTLDFTKINNTSITGIIGKKGTLEKEFYTNLDYQILENEANPKIFVFHSAIDEFKPEELASMDGTPLALLPKNFTYYAGGHVHYRFIKETLNGTICFPGPTCPNSFSEWVDLEHGSFIIGEYDENETNPKIKLESRKVKLLETKSINITLNNLTPIDAERKIKDSLTDLKDKLVLLTIEGSLESGNLSDIHFNEINNIAMQNGAYNLLRNTSKVNSKKVKTENFEGTDLNIIEQEIITDMISESKLKNLNEGEIDLTKQKEFVTTLISHLSKQKEEGETNTDFEERIESEFEAIANGLN